VSIYTNDPKHPKLRVVVTGKIEKFAEIQPKRVHLKGSIGTPLMVEVKISPNPSHPFNIIGVQVRKNKFIRSELIEPCNTETNRCVLRVENLKTTRGRYTDTITIQTDSKVRPSFSIQVVGNILQ
jgi:hypothetical protein